MTGEHGIGVDKAQSLPLQFAEADLNFMYRLRRRLRSRPSDESRQAAAHASGVRGGIPARAAGAARRDVGVSVTTRALGDALARAAGPRRRHRRPGGPRRGRGRRLAAALGRAAPVAGRGCAACWRWRTTKGSPCSRAAAAARWRSATPPERARRRARSRAPRRDPRVQPGRPDRDRAGRRDGRRAGGRARRATADAAARSARMVARARSAGSPPPRPAARSGCATARCAICCSASASSRPTACRPGAAPRS